MQKQIEDTIARLDRYAIRSSTHAFISFCFVVALFAPTAWVLRSAQEIAEKEVDKARETASTLNPVDLNDISSCGRTAVAVGDDGAIVVSNNPAQSWKNVELASDDHLLAVSFSTDCSHVVAAGHDGTLLQSSDGGNSWTAGFSGTENRIRSVAINEDGKTRVAVGDNGLFIASINGGSWNKVRGLEQGVGNSVALSDSGEAVIVTSRGDPVRIFRKDEEGRFRLHSESSKDGGRFAASVVESGTPFSALAVGNDGAILAYRDSDDRNWTSIQSNREGDFLDVTARESKFLAVGRSGIQVASVDGKKWSSPSGLQGNDLNSVAMNRSATAAVAVGEDGTILLALTDPDWWAGKFREEEWAWESIDLRTTSEFTGVTFVSEDEFVIVGHKRIVRGSDSRRTSLYFCDLPDNLNSTTSSQEVDCFPVDGIEKALEEKSPKSGGEDDVGAAARDYDTNWWSNRAFIELLQTNVIRIGTITLFVFLASHLFRLARYYSRLAAYYRARSDALGLSSEKFSQPTNVADMERLMFALSPDHLETKPSTNSSTPYSTLQPFPLPK